MNITADTILLISVGLGGMLGGYAASRRGARQGAEVLNGTVATMQRIDATVAAMALQVVRLETRLEQCPLADRRRRAEDAAPGCR